MPASRAVVRRAGLAKTAKEEIDVLREDAEELTQQLTHLQRKRREELGREGPWKKLAYDQSTEKMEAIQENQKLRAALVECKTLSASLLQLMNRMDPCTRELTSAEEMEWKMNVLGSDPIRRHYNADRIMEKLYRKLPSWSINNGLVDAVDDTHYNYCEHRTRADEPMHVEVVMCRRIAGHYVDVANAVWRHFVNEDMETSAAVSVRTQTAEILGNRIRHITPSLRMYVDGRAVDHTIHQLCQRIEDESRVVVMWKAVTEELDTKGMQFTDNADGWVSFEKVSDAEGHEEYCIMKFSAMTEVLPIDTSSPRMGNGLLHLLKMMSLSHGLDATSGTDPEPPWTDTIERARRVFGEFMLETLWRHAKQIERLATGPKSDPVTIVSF